VPGTRYEVIRWLGQGGMGIVYEARHVDIARRVALKIPTGFGGDPRHTEILREEARTASLCGSPNIVEIFDIGELPDGRTWIAMEFLDGVSLGDVMAAERIDTGRLIAIARQICRGLGAAHDAGIVHGDVKPENVVLVSRDGRADMVKIVDFGVAAVLGAEEGAVAGTPMYMAPEQIVGLPWDGRLDVYALGCLLYQAVVGTPPFVSDCSKEVLLRHLEDTPIPPEPGPLSHVIMRCLEKQACDRWASMVDLEAALCEAQIAAGITTAWDDLPLPDVEPERRGRLLRGMPDPATLAAESYRAKWALPAAIIGSLALGGLVTFAVLVPTEQTQVDRDRTGELADAARAAAARALFVYPLPREPGAPTAYKKVRELETLPDDAGLETAQGLRDEFAQTLVRLGDEYWERDGGREFAVEFYAQAIVFDPEHARARERSFLTPGREARLAAKAETLQFDASELEAAEVLGALGDPDASSRGPKLASFLSRKKTLGVLAHRSLEKLARVPEPKRTVVEAVDEAPVEMKAEPSEEAAPEPELRSPGKADALARSGIRELRAGRRKAAEQLFYRALDLDRGNARALGGLGSAHFEAGRYAQAVGYAEKAVARSPRDGGHRIQLGDAYYKTHRYSAARRQYEKAAELGHGHAAGRLAKVRGKLGD
jgi:tetratricopeptide (TPR) repeat protein/predicted Ser/Thr protein kinase